MGRYFGTDGFRGAANDELTAERAFKIGRFLGWYFNESKKGKGERARIVIGKDTRRSGYMYEAALVAGIVASGADAYLLHVTTTPSVAYTVRAEAFDCGVMISASHNPFYDNGVKLFNGQGEKMEEDVIALVEDYLDGEVKAFSKTVREAPYAKGEGIGRSVDYAAGRNRYIGYLISLGLYSFKGVKVGLDCANGSAWHIAKTVFDALGATTFVMGAEPDGTNINKGCGSTHIDALRNFVKEKGLDIGFAFDGDADRCLCVDENGELVDGDKIMYICARHMKERGEFVGNTLVTTVMSNFGLYKALDELGISYEKTAVGDKYVYERMSEKGYILGGEQSGHIIFSKYACTGDGIVTALKVMEVMLERKTTISALASSMTSYPQVLENVRVSNKRAAKSDADVCAAVREIEKRLGQNGRILLRESGTEPVVRVMVEAPEEALCKECVDEVVAVIRAKGHAIS